MTYKQIPFTLEEWQKDPEGRKIKATDGTLSRVVMYFAHLNQFSIIWEDGDVSKYSRFDMHNLTLLIPVNTVRMWRNLDRHNAGNWFANFKTAISVRGKDCYATESAEFDEEGNYVKGTVKVEEV